MDACLNNIQLSNMPQMTFKILIISDNNISIITNTIILLKQANIFLLHYMYIIHIIILNKNIAYKSNINKIAKFYMHHYQKFVIFGYLTFCQ